MTHSESRPGLRQLLQCIDKDTKVKGISDEYLEYFDQNDADHEKTEQRKRDAPEMTNRYYDIATDFYEYGWGESFHFSSLGRGETREHAIAKHEYRLALKLGINPSNKVLDLGCGIGGPAREISRFTEAKIVGLNNNAYQVKRAEELTKKAGMQDSCSFVKGNFLNAPFPNCHFDKVYAIEATCHAPDLVQVYSEAFRLLKPGGLFGCYEWVLTEKFDPNNHHHKKIKHDIQEGNSLPDMYTPSHVLESLRKAGFEVEEEADLAIKSPVPWYTVLQAKWAISDLKITPLGRWLTHLALVTMETIALAPKGSVSTHRMLCKGADGLVKGGKEGIFTPLYFVLAKKTDS